MRAFLLLLTAVAAAAVYQPALRGGFSFDDIPNIVDNPSIRMVRLDLPSLRQAVTPAGPVAARRPAASLSFAFNHLLGRYDPLGYRLTNLAILLVSIPFAYWLALLVGGTWHGRREAEALALGAAALWILHPLLTNGVSYIVQRMTSLCALFSLAALCFFLEALRTGRRRWHAPALLAWALALLTKEIAVLLPLVAALYLCLRLEPGSAGRRRAWWSLAALVILSQAALFLYSAGYPSWEMRPFTMAERLLTETRVVMRYLTLFLAPLPARLNLDYDFPLSTSLLAPPGTLIALAAHLGLIAVALAAARRRPLFSFGILSFYLLQLLESTFLPLEIIFEHRAYLPSFFLSLALTDLIFACSRKVTDRAAGGMLLTALLLSALGGALTYKRNLLWASDLDLARDVAGKSPGKARARYNLGVALIDLGRQEEALGHLEGALKLNPRDGEARVRRKLGVVLAELGRHDQALRFLNEALALDPRSGEILNSIGSLRVRLGDLDGAREAFSEVLRLTPRSAEALSNLGNVHFLQGRREDARRAYEEAIFLQPSYPDAHYNMGTLLASEGRIPDAIAAYERALDFDPGHSGAHYNLGVALARQGRLPEAAEHFRETLRLVPDHSGARLNLEKVETLNTGPARVFRKDPPAASP